MEPNVFYPEIVEHTCDGKVTHHYLPPGFSKDCALFDGYGTYLMSSKECYIPQDMLSHSSVFFNAFVVSSPYLQVKTGVMLLLT